MSFLALHEKREAILFIELLGKERLYLSEKQVFLIFFSK